MKTNYVTPQIEVIEIEIEDAVLAGSPGARVENVINGVFYDPNLTNSNDWSNEI